ncbi:MAG: ABC-2 family transporter protein [Firmicutes bacterium]|nr:ABC-2 family transporter protein [Bacillota bacterium]
MFKNIKFIFSSFKLNVKKEWQYKSSFFIQIFLMIVNNAGFIGVFAIIFTITNEIGGMNFNDVILLFGISAGGFGVKRLFFAGSQDLRDLVFNARLDVYMTQPKNLLVNVSTSKTEISAIGDILTSFLVLGLIGATWWWYLAIIPIAIISGLVYWGAYTFWHSAVFYIKGGDAFAKMGESTMLKAGNYPFSIYDNVVKIVFATIIPAYLFTHLPALNILIDFNVWWLLVYVGGAIAWLLLAFAFFHLSVRRYNSGSVMGGRD